MADYNSSAFSVTKRAALGLLGFAAVLSLTAGNASAGSPESVVFRFPASLVDGYFPDGRLTQDSAGNLYGTTALGATSTNYYGTIFKFVPPTGSQTTGQFAILYQFTGATGAQPQGSLALGAKGVLYGTTPAGGDGLNDGTVFELIPPAAGQSVWKEVVIHTFDHGVDGSSPAAGVLVGKNGNLYGALASGYTGYGAIFAFAPPKNGVNAPWDETIVYKFKGGSDGFVPKAPPLADANGALYGTTTDNGPTTSGNGTIYKLTPPAAGNTVWTKTTLYRFKGAADGSAPTGPLVRDSSGALYGTTAGGNGTVFKLTPPTADKTAWVLTTLHSFTDSPDGRTPGPGGLVMDNQGALIGTTLYGGTANGRGTVFKLMPPKSATGKWTETVLYRFAGGTDGNSGASVLASPNGTLFGVTYYGGTTGCSFTPYPGGCGTIFKLTQ
jgi:uncharacterized repeat protein (TIGR03803 family)